MLLNHTSGMPDHVFSFAVLRVILGTRLFGDNTRRFTPIELIELILDREPLFSAGEGYNYTDTGYLLVGLIVERATGRRYEDLLHERFLGPLKLTMTEPTDELVVDDE